MLEVKFWMDAVCLKLNKSKTEFINFGSQQLLKKCNALNIKVINETVTRWDKVTYIEELLIAHCNSRLTSLINARQQR